MNSANFTVPSFVDLTVADLDKLVEQSRSVGGTRAADLNAAPRRTLDSAALTVTAIDQASDVIAPGPIAAEPPPMFAAPRPIAAVPPAVDAANVVNEVRIKRTHQPMARRVAIAAGTAVIGAFSLLSLQLVSPIMPASWSESRLGLRLESAPTSKPESDSASNAIRNSANNPSSGTTGKVEAASAALLAGEKEKISKFLAQRYRTELYQTEHIVHHSFEVARELNMDPWLILAVIAIESNLNPRAVSARDARGLMQIHALAHTGKFTPHGGIDMAFHPETNIRVGASILRDYINRHASVQGALKAYVGAALLPDDNGYGAKVLAEQEQIAAAALGLPACQSNDRSECKSVVKRQSRTRVNDARGEQVTDARARQYIEAGAAGDIKDIELIQ